MILTLYEIRIKSILNTFSFVLSEISLPQNHWNTGKPSGNFNMTKYDENITKVLTYIYGDDLSLNQSDFENPDWRLKVIGPNDENSNWTFIHSMYSKFFIISHIFLVYSRLSNKEKNGLNEQVGQNFSFIILKISN